MDPASITSKRERKSTAPTPRGVSTARGTASEVIREPDVRERAGLSAVITGIGI
jgi:hypothetical protein